MLRVTRHGAKEMLIGTVVLFVVAAPGRVELVEIDVREREGVDEAFGGGVELRAQLLFALLGLGTLGEPFRRDAMKTPVKVAGIDARDMKPQQLG